MQVEANVTATATVTETSASAISGVLCVATEWCRQMVSVEPGGFARILAPDARVHGLAPDGSALRGPSAVQDYFTQLKVLCKSTACDVGSAIVQGDRATLRWVMRFQAGLGACDRRETQIEGMSMIATSDGLIVEVWNSYGSTWV
jgi:hypothetical protein